jgi:hypothetical protein
MTPGTCPPAHRHRHGQSTVGQLRVMVFRQRESEHPARAHVQDRGEVELALAGGDLGPVAVPFLVDIRRREVALDQVGRAPAPLAGPRRRPAPPPAPGCQVLLAHHLGDGVLAHPPPGIPQVGGDPRRAVRARVQPEQAGRLGGQPAAPLCARR